MKRPLFKVLALSLPLLAAAASAQNGPPRGGPDREKMRAAFEACATELGISKPQAGQRPSEENRRAMETCLASKGVTRPSGQRPPPPAREGEGGSEGSASIR